ncbi:mitochondrial uncoupling protein 2-like [Nothobranchius furzeri]|uniref:Mitochondrial uncoupling protein 2-like n=1 Tax=Nothobranchius furzeri TaxID=105023 RepID=A0A9D3BSH3_NOTFU|nr:mitochondrial uncoupling protein 2-like [Nothobranchius furzeri]
MVGGGTSNLEPSALGKEFSAGCVADLVTFPLDTAKVRLQIQGEAKISEGQRMKYRGVFGTIITIVKTLYIGLVAGLRRQVCFASIRIGLYDTVKQLYASGAESRSAYWFP